MKYDEFKEKIEVIPKIAGFLEECSLKQDNIDKIYTLILARQLWDIYETLIRSYETLINLVEEK